LNKNIIFGGSGLVGLSLRELLRNKKDYLYYSKNNKKFKKFNLDKDIKKFPFKKINTCFFFASPRIKKKNFFNNKFVDELNWLKKVVTNIEIKKFIYLSSSSVYYNKTHIIGSVKRKCEKYIIQNKKKFKYYQIWRPFNLIGKSYLNSDHFHNFLFKIMFIKNNKKFNFSGNLKDKRGYSDVNSFTRVLYSFSNKNISFIKNYGNKNMIKVSEIIDLYNSKYQKINRNKFIAKFKSKTTSINSIASKKNNIYYNKKSILVLKKYLLNSLNEKKVQHM